MADADEDAIPRTSNANPDDFEDETQDFRFLSSITAAKSGQTIVPKRGDKDFEPNPTRSQASALDASRLAMHTALSSVRVHVGKHVVGQYLPSEGDWRWDDNGTGAGRNGRCVVVPKFKGIYSKTMGLADRHNSTWFLPEEALFLLERGTLDIRWPDTEDEDEDEDEDDKNEEGNDVPERGEEIEEKADTVAVAEEEEEKNSKSEPQTQQEPDSKIGELPMSLQGAYASFIGKDGLTLERYTVYAGLKRIGYIVQRAPTWHDEDTSSVNGHVHSQIDTQNPIITTPSSSSSPPPMTPKAISNAVSLIHRLVSWLSQPSSDGVCTASGPLVAPGLYRNYTDMFRALSLIPYHDATRPSPSSPGSDSDSDSNNDNDNVHNKEPHPNRTTTPKAPFRVHFHVWKPNVQNSYRKSAPPPPDYRIAVVDARTTSMPTLSEIGDLLNSQPDDFLTKDKAGRLETRIRYGRKNVLLAVVDMGVVSYLRLSDACFGAEKLYEEKVRAGSKGKRPRPNQSGTAPRKGNQTQNHQQQQQQQQSKPK